MKNYKFSQIAFTTNYFHVILFIPIWGYLYLYFNITCACISLCNNVNTISS